jgi:hypothetical protein
VPVTSCCCSPKARPEAASTAASEPRNRARRRADGSYLPALSGAIETEDGATVLVTLVGHGAPRAEPEGRVVAAILHEADGDYAWLDDVLGVVSGTVREREVVLEVAELVWEPPQQ